MDQNEEIEQAIGDTGGILSPEQAARILDGALFPGDTTQVENNVSVPGTETADPKAGGNTEGTKTGPGTAGTGEAGTQTVDENQLNAQNAVILAKDGVHTIGYEKLAEARAQAQAAQERLANAQAELAQLRQQAQARVDAGVAPTQTDKLVEAAQAAINAGADVSLYGDFSEEALASGIAKNVELQVAQQVAAQMAQINAVIKPLQAARIEADTQAHYGAIYQAHPDADSIPESREFKAWMDAQPSMARTAYDHTLKAGSTQEVVELFSAFKQATGSTTQPAATATAGKSPEEIAAAAKAKVASTRAAPPASLTDIPSAAVVDAGNPFATIDAMSPAAQVEAVAKLSPDQLQAFLNRTL